MRDYSRSSVILLEYKKMSADTIYEGPITMTRKGFGFFAIKDASEDLIIPPEWANHALSGDIVKVVSSGNYRDPSGKMPPRASGKVVEIVSRARETFVGTLTEENGKILLAPDYKKMFVPIEISPSQKLGTIGEMPIGYKVLVRLQGWKENTPYPFGIVEEIIGKAGVHETEMRALALGQGFSSDFPPGVISDAEYLEKNGAELLAEEVTARIARNPRRHFFSK